MEYGQESSLTEINEWWGPDLTLPPAGSIEERAGQQIFSVNKEAWNNHKGTLLCTPDNMPTGEYKIVNREAVQYIMEDRYEYLITVEWEL